MRIKLQLLLILLVFFQTCGNAATIGRFSIKGENGVDVFVENGKNIGHVIRDTKSTHNVKKILYKNKIYFMKDVDSNRVLELQGKIGSIIASYILNEIFKDEEKRYPSLRLMFNHDSIISNVNPFYLFSEELKDFVSIADISKEGYKKYTLKAGDLENLYIGMYLVGGGDPNMRNIFYNLRNHHLGNVDLDVSFKEHVKHEEQLKHNEEASPGFLKKYSDLAVRTINCDNIFVNFLSATDSMFNKKIPWDRYYDGNIPLYKETLRMDRTRLGEAIDILRNAFPNKASLRLLIDNIVVPLKKELKNIIIENLEEMIVKDKGKLKDEAKDEARSIFDDRGDYFNKDSGVYKKYKEYDLVRSTYFLFAKEDDEDYIQKIYRFVENRYLTLICIFDGSCDIAKETCEECLLKPEIHEQCRHTDSNSRYFF